MRTFIACFALFFAFMLTSCAEKQVDMESDTPQAVLARTPMSPLREQITAGTFNEYLVLWRTLSATEQHGLWLEKLTETRNMPRWNTQQVAKIDFYRNTLTADVFSIIKSAEADSLLRIELETVFTPMEVMKIFTNVYPYHQHLFFGPIASDPTSSDCECLWSLSCGFGKSCDIGGCVRTSGCGIWGTSNCRGICDIPRI